MGKTKHLSILPRRLADDQGVLISVSNPLPTDGDSIYEKDILSFDAPNWGEPEVVLRQIQEDITNTTSDNPKLITFNFKRPILTNKLKLSTNSENFSNVKVIGLLLGGEEIELVDESGDNTDYINRDFDFVPQSIYGIRLEFHSADTQTLSWIQVLKTQSVVSRLQAIKPDGLLANINATQGGNLKVSIEEQDGSAGLSIEQKQKTLFDYEMNDLDDTTTTDVTYIGKETPAGDWLVNKLDETTGISSGWANISNNSGRTTYTAAWDNRVTLTYEDISSLTF